MIEFISRHFTCLLQVMHDCRADSEALFYIYGVRLGPVWDTQIALGLVERVARIGKGGDDVIKRPGLNYMLEVI